MRSLGRSLQFFALVFLPLAMLLEISNSLGRDSGVADLLLLLGFGIACFGIGRIVETYAGR